MSFVPSHPGCHTALHPPWILASPGQAAASAPGAFCDLDESDMAAAPSSSCARVFRSPGSQGHPREAVSWQGSVGSTSLFLCCYSSAVLGCYQLLPLPAVSYGGLAVASSTVGTALPIPDPSHGAAGCSGGHLVRAACVSQPELVTMSTLKQ